MDDRIWEDKAKAMSVREGRTDKPAEICGEHQLSHVLFYEWRDQYLAYAAKPLRSSRTANARRA